MLRTATNERERNRALLQPLQIGKLSHAVATEQLEQGRPFDPKSLRETVDAFLPARTAGTYRQAVRQRVITALIVYRRELVPEGWRFVSGEHIARDVKLDLLWATSNGSLVADELKTGSWPLVDELAIRRQCATQCHAAREAFGDSFEMVRLIVPSARKIGEMTPEAAGVFRWR